MRRVSFFCLYFKSLHSRSNLATRMGTQLCWTGWPGETFHSTWTYHAENWQLLRISKSNTRFFSYVFANAKSRRLIFMLSIKVLTWRKQWLHLPLNSGIIHTGLILSNSSQQLFAFSKVKLLRFISINSKFAFHPSCLRSLQLLCGLPFIYAIIYASPWNLSDLLPPVDFCGTFFVRVMSQGGFSIIQGLLSHVW